MIETAGFLGPWQQKTVDVDAQEAVARSHNSPDRFSPFQKIVAIWIAVAAAIVAAYFLTSRKEPPPKPSTISYSERPSERMDRSRLENRARFGSPRTIDPPRRSGENTEPEDPLALIGLISEAGTNQPLEGAFVRSMMLLPQDEGSLSETEGQDEAEAARMTPAFLDKAHGARRSTKTNDKGQYALPIPMSGRYLIQVARAGFVRRREVVEFVEGGEKQVRLDLTLSKGASITGRVLEAGTNAGIPLILITAHNEEGTSSAETETAPDGTYELTGLVPGTYQVALDLTRQPYKAPERIPVQNVVIQHPDEKRTDINFTLSPAGTVWGYITDHEKQPVQGAQVYLCTSESLISQVLNAAVHQMPPLNSRSEKDGYYELIGVPLNQEWRVYATTDEYAPQLTDPFIVTASARNIRVDIHVLRGTSVYGRVLDQDGAPISNADTICAPSYSKLLQRLDEARALRHTESETDGSYVIANLPPGDYQILAQKDGYKIALMGDPLYADGFSDIQGFDLMLTAVDSGRYVIYGKVVDAGGHPVPGVNLTLSGLGTESMSATEMETRSDERGDFGFYGIESGFLVILAEKEGYTSQQVSEVRLDEPTTIVMQAAGLVRGRVLVRETGQPPARYNVRALPSDTQQSGIGLALMSSGDPRDMRSFNHADGSFELALAPGEYTIEATAQGLTPGRQAVSALEGQSIDGVIVYVSQSGGVIQGQLQTMEGGAPAGATVWLGGAAEAQFGRLVDMVAQTQRHGVQVGADGRFEFRNLADGTYTVLAQAEGYAQGSSGPVQVAQSRTVTGVVVMLGSGGRLQGYVARNGVSLPGAMVTVIGSGVSEMASADQNGQYAIDGLAAGSYLATAVSFEGRGTDLFAPMHAQVEIREGEITVHNFGEESGASVQGLCTPPPASGSFGFALLRTPGSPATLTGLNLVNPADWYSGVGAGGAPGILGMSPIRDDGYFKIDNCPEGDYQLDILYVNLGEAMSGTGRPRSSHAVSIRGDETIELDIQVPGS
ncbi:MAG: carboxypeptidase regulatory-like domain-containing protein [Candidatus Hydrogenedentales bacterium]